MKNFDTKRFFLKKKNLPILAKEPQFIRKKLVVLFDANVRCRLGSTYLGMEAREDHGQMGYWCTFCFA